MTDPITDAPALPAAPAAAPSLSADAVFGAPPLIAGEDAGAYADLLARVGAAVRPADILEEIWVRDVVDLVWEGQRLRRLKTHLVNSVLHRGVRQAVGPLIGWEEANAVSARWQARDARAVARVETLLAHHGLSMDAVIAAALESQLEPVERIDRLITEAELRRNVALREVERHRAALGRSLRRAVDDVEDAEFAVLDPPGRSLARSAA
jgi:hypothetical protein